MPIDQPGGNPPSGHDSVRPQREQDRVTVGAGFLGFRAAEVFAAAFPARFFGGMRPPYRPVAGRLPGGPSGGWPPPASQGATLGRPAAGP